MLGGDPGGRRVCPWERERHEGEYANVDQPRRSLSTAHARSCLSAWLAVALLGVTRSGHWHKTVATEQSHSRELLSARFMGSLLTRSSDDLLLFADMHRVPSKVVRSIASHGTP